MNGYNFTERVRKVFALARAEAHRLNHEYVGTEHILLGLIREGEGIANAVLENLKIDAGVIRQNLEDTVLRGKAPVEYPDLPYTSRSKKSIELAMAEARELSHNYVGTEHLLLGLLREEKGIAAQVLTDAGLTLSDARAEVLRLVGSVMGEITTTSTADVLGVEIEIRFADGKVTRGDFHSTRKAIEFLRNIHPPKLPDRQE
jgi:ATP-dependent Clp protease ATP-binding subunit ClpC